MPRSDVAARRTAPVAPEAPVSPSVEEQVERIMARPYHRIVRGDPEEGYLAKVAEFPGCFTAGETPTEAMELLEDAMRAWLVVALEERQEIPEPNPEPSDDYSGRFVLRVPKMLHQQLAERAHAEGVSLNTFAVTLLSLALGQRTSAGSSSRGGSTVERPWGQGSGKVAEQVAQSLRTGYGGGGGGGSIRVRDGGR